MKFYNYTVYFVGGEQGVVNTSGTECAVILACANRIQQGKHLSACCVECQETREIRHIEAALGGNAVFVNWI